MSRRTTLILLLLCAAATAPAEDWLEWRGPGRLGVWTETGIVVIRPNPSAE